MNEYEELHLEWGMSTDGRTVERYIFDKKNSEIKSLREQLAKELETSQRLNDDLANALDVIEKEREHQDNEVEKLNEMLEKYDLKLVILQSGEFDLINPSKMPF